MSKIRNIVFDCSDVLLHFVALDVMREMAPTPEEGDRYWNEILYHPAWQDYNLGVTNREQAHAIMLQGMEGVQRQVSAEFLKCWYDSYEEMPDMRALVGRIKAAGYKVYVLSDFPEVFEHLYQKFEFLHEFDGLVVSYKAGLAKFQGAPIFRYFCKQFGLKAEECFFTDDTPFNVEAAKSIGMQGCVFQGAKELEQTLHGLIRF